MADESGGWKDPGVRQRFLAISVLVLLGISVFAAGTHDVVALGTSVGFVVVILGFGDVRRPRP